MKKAIIITGAVIALAGAGFLGYGWYLSEPTKTITTENYSFKVPKSFKLEDQNGDYKLTFKCLGENIVITDEHLNCKPELIDKFIPYYADDENRQLEKLEDYPYTGYFSSSTVNSSGKNITDLTYMLGTDTHFLSADCNYCSSLKAGIIKKIMSNVVKTAEYTSDFRIATKPDVYDYEWFSVDTGSKYYILDSSEEFKSSHENGLVWVREWYAEADSAEKMASPSVGIQVEKSDDSPADRADKVYNPKLEKEENYPVLTRDVKNRFGFECEHFFMEYAPKSSDSALYYDLYYFRNGDNLFTINVFYDKIEDKADAEEMLDGITIKDIK